MVPPPQGSTPCSEAGPAARLFTVGLLILAAACGGDGGTEPPTLHPTRLALVTQPSTQGQSRLALTPQPVIQLQDDQGAAVPQAGVPVTASIATGGGDLIGTTTVNTSSTGRATFTQLAVSGLAGPRTLTFTSPNLVSVTSGTIELSPGAAATISVNGGDGQNAATGIAVPVPPSVVVTDADNNPVSGVPVTFQVTLGGGTVEPATPVNTNANGVATVTSWTLGASPGPNTLSAAASGLAGSPVVFDATGLGGTSTITGTITVNNSLAASAKSPSTMATKAIPLRNFARSQLSSPTRLVPRYAPNELIVTFQAAKMGAPRTGSSALAIASTAAAVSENIRSHIASRLSLQRAAITGVSPAIMAAKVRVNDPANVDEVAASLRMDPAVSSIQRNGMVWSENRSVPPERLGVRPPTRSSNDPLFAFQAWHYGMIDLPEAWSITTGSASVLVAVVDDGIRFDHPGIAANLTRDGYDFVSNPFPVDLCSGGTITFSGDGDDYDPDPTIPAEYHVDESGLCLTGLMESGNHGLHVAGTIGAVGNDAVGVSGISWSVRIRPVRVLGIYGGGTEYDVAQGILYAAGLPADNGSGGFVRAPTRAHIINMSFRASTVTVLEDAIQAAADAGALLIAAAGNAGTSDAVFPAAYPEVLSVSAVGPDRQLASYSSFGSTVDIAAPGGDFVDGGGSFAVMSTVWNFVTGSPTYDVAQGTSMATPHVAGVAALILAANPGLSASQLRSRLVDYAVDVGAPGRDNSYGAGIVNARNSLAQNLAPTRQLRARLYDALTGGVLQTVPVSGGSYSFAGVTNGTYYVFAGQDDSGDQLIGLPGRRWGASGGTATPTSIDVSSAGTYRASFSIGFPSEAEPNATRADAGILPVGGYSQGTAEPSDVDMYRVLIPLAGEYTFETSPLDGACGFALEANTLLELYDADGDRLTSNDDIDPDAFGYCSRVTATLAPGTYYVGVQGHFGGRYRVQARSGS